MALQPPCHIGAFMASPMFPVITPPSRYAGQLETMKLRHSSEKQPCALLGTVCILLFVMYVYLNCSCYDILYIIRERKSSCYQGSEGSTASRQYKIVAELMGRTCERMIFGGAACWRCFASLFHCWRWCSLLFDVAAAAVTAINMRCTTEYVTAWNIVATPPRRVSRGDGR